MIPTDNLSMLSKSRIVRQDFGQLNNLVKAMSQKAVVRIGIMGAKNSKHTSDDGKGGMLTNAEIGAIHEFGSLSGHLPARSWLRMPIHKGAAFIVKKAKEEIKVMAEKGSILPILVNIGIRCEQFIQRAFASRGFGEWEPIKPATKKAKGSSAILIDTGQLRRSVSSKVVLR